MFVGQKSGGKVRDEKRGEELMEHSWLKYYPWNELQEKILPEPFIPEKKDNFDKHNLKVLIKFDE